LVGVAVKVTLPPAHMVVALAEMVTAGTTREVTVIVTGFDVAVAGKAQVAVEVITQVIRSPFAKDEFVYVLLFVPVFPPFSFHW
jgi:hypothetical protein